MFETASTRIKRIQKETGLTDATLLKVLLDYIDMHCDPRQAGDYVLEQAEPAPDEREDGNE